jgi:hypothetical protein
VTRNGQRLDGDGSNEKKKKKRKKDKTMKIGRNHSVMEGIEVERIH